MSLGFDCINAMGSMCSNGTPRNIEFCFARFETNRKIKRKREMCQHLNRIFPEFTIGGAETLTNPSTGDSNKKMFSFVCYVRPKYMDTSGPMIPVTQLFSPVIQQFL